MSVPVETAAGGGGGVHAVVGGGAAAGSAAGAGVGTGSAAADFGGVGRGLRLGRRLGVGRWLLGPRRRGQPFVVGHGPLLVPPPIGRGGSGPESSSSTQRRKPAFTNPRGGRSQNRSNRARLPTRVVVAPRIAVTGASLGPRHARIGHAGDRRSLQFGVNTTPVAIRAGPAPDRRAASAPQRRRATAP